MIVLFALVLQNENVSRILLLIVFYKILDRSSRMISITWNWLMLLNSFTNFLLYNTNSIVYTQTYFIQRVIQNKISLKIGEMKEKKQQTNRKMAQLNSIEMLFNDDSLNKFFSPIFGKL